MPHATWTYPADIADIIDGDTVRVTATIWPLPAETMTADIRLDGINAREHTMPGGPEATAHLAALAPVGSPVTLVVVGPDKYGTRVRGRVLTPAGVDVAQQMVVDGYAAPWDGRGPKPVPAWPIAAAA